jgi:predicted nucleotidyltransferase
MHSIIEQHKDKLIALCREFGVARLEVFGSVMTGEFDPARSDIDFLVTYPPDYDFGPWLTRFQELEERLSALFQWRVDLVIAKEFRNPFFARAVKQTRQLVYAA